MMNLYATQALEPGLLATWTERLGPATFFVPCRYGTKRPLVPYVDRSHADTTTPDYRAHFRHANIAVYLGKASEGLCAIDFDADEDLAAFDELNPKLRRTLRTRGRRGAMLWLRMEGDYPESCNPAHKHFEWRADGRLSMLAGRHPAV